MALFGGKVGRIQGKISRKEFTIKRLRDRLRNWRSYNYKNKAEAERRHRADLDRNIAELQGLKFDLSQAKAEERRKARPTPTKIIKPSGPSLASVMRKTREKIGFTGDLGVSSRQRKHELKRKQIAQIRRQRARASRAQPVAQPAQPTKSVGAVVGSTVGGIYKSLKDKLAGPVSKPAPPASSPPAKDDLVRRQLAGTASARLAQEDVVKEAKARAKYGARYQSRDVISPFVMSWIKIILTIVIILLIVGAILFFALIYSGGALGKQAGVVAEEPLSKLKATIFGFAERIKRQITGVGEWRNPYVTEAEEKKGVEIELKPQGPFLSGSDINLFVTGIVKALEEPTTVFFNCSIEETISGKPDPELIDVPKNVDEPFIVNCKLKSPVVEDDSETKKIKFSAIYTGYKTESKLKLWTMPSDELKSLEEANIKPFEKDKERYEALARFDKLLRLDKYERTVSSYTYGPVILAMYVYKRQPLSETTDKPYDLVIGIDNDEELWGGELVQMDDGTYGRLKLNFPPDITSDCDEIVLKTKKDTYTKTCKLSLSEVEAGLSFMQLEAELVYDYEFSKKGTIVIEKVKGEVVEEEEVDDGTKILVKSLVWEDLGLYASVTYVEKGDRLTIEGVKYIVKDAKYSDDKTKFYIIFEDKTLMLDSSLIVGNIEDIEKYERPSSP